MLPENVGYHEKKEDSRKSATNGNAGYPVHLHDSRTNDCQKNEALHDRDLPNNF
jgi:hypothetical protein